MAHVGLNHLVDIYIYSVSDILCVSFMQLCALLRFFISYVSCFFISKRSMFFISYVSLFLALHL